MRYVFLAALALGALPALAQTDDADREPRRVVIDIDSVMAEVDRVELDTDEVDGERRIVIRRRAGGEVDEQVVALRLPDRERIESLLGVADSLSTVHSGLLGEMFGEMGGASETRRRMRQLEREAQTLAREARASDGAERRDVERRLDAVLDELFDVRAEARRERAERLRERAAELEAEADAVEASLDDREARRRAIIEARRAELLGESPTSDW